MARRAMTVKDERRKALIEKYAEQRRELRERSRDKALPLEERMAAGRALAELPRNSCPTRLKNRCLVTGRSRGFIRKFGMSRISFRELALTGHLPGVTKASW